MPTENAQPTTLFAACVDPRCKGHKQRPIPGYRIETSWTYAERGGDLPGIEDSRITFKAEKTGQEEGQPNDTVCRECGGNVDITDQVRPVYPNVSGHSPSEGLKYLGTWKPAKERGAEVDAVLERLQDVIKGG